MQTTKNRKIALIAIAAVAVVGAGSAFAAAKLHTGSAQATSASRNGGFRPGGGGGGFHGDGFRGGGGGSLQSAASYLGITTQQLFTDLRSGKTLAQIANATKGKSTSGLISAMVAAQKQSIAQAVSSGRLTQAQATSMQANLTQRVTQMVNGTGFRGFGGRPGGGGGNGPGPPDTL